MKKIITNSLLLTCLISTPAIFLAKGVDNEIKQEKATRWVYDNTDYDHPESAYKPYYNVDRDVMPWDMFGDWTIPERYVDWGDVGVIVAGMGGYYGMDPINPTFPIENSYYTEEEGASHSLQQRINYHEG